MADLESAAAHPPVEIKNNVMNASEHVTAGLLACLKSFECLPSPPPVAALQCFLKDLHACIDTAQSLDSPMREPNGGIPALGMKAIAFLTSCLYLVLQSSVLAQLPTPSDTAPNQPPSQLLRLDKRYMRCSIPVPKGVAINPSHVAAVASSTGQCAAPETPRQVADVTTSATTAGFRETLYWDCVKGRAEVILQGCQTAVTALQLKALDARMHQRIAADVLLGCFQLHVWGRQRPGDMRPYATQADVLLTQLRESFGPSRAVYVGALLQVLWNEVMHNVVVVSPGERVPDHSSSRLSLPEHLRLLASAQLCSILCAPDGKGVVDVLDAVSDAIDMADAVAAERAMNSVAAVIAKPPLAVISAQEYLARVAPQLLKLLRLRGVNSWWFRETAAFSLLNILADKAWCSRASNANSSVNTHSKDGTEPTAVLPGSFYPYKENDEHSLLFQHVIYPLCRPLFGYVDPSLVGEGTVFTVDDVIGCVEDCHAILCGRQWLPPRIILRMLPVFTALCDIQCFCGDNKLRANTAAACSEICGALLSCLPPEWTVFVALSSLHSDASDAFLQLWQRHLTAKGSDSTQLPPPLPSKNPQLHPQASGPSGIEIVWRPISIKPAESLLSDDIPFIRPSISLSKPSASGNIMADLLSVGARLSPSISNEGAKTNDNKTSLGEAGQAEINGFSLQDRVNTIVAWLRSLPTASKGGETKPKGEEKGVVVEPTLLCFHADSGTSALFAHLLSRYVLTRTSEAASPEGAASAELGLLVGLMEDPASPLLSSSLTVLQALRTLLHFLLVATGQAIPSSEACGLMEGGGDKGLPAAIHVAGVRYFGAVTQHNHASIQDMTPDIEDMCSMIVGLLSSIAVPRGMAGMGAGEGVVKAMSVGEWCWLRSTLPLLASLSAGPHPTLAEMASTLRGFIQVLPAPSNGPAGDSDGAADGIVESDVTGAGMTINTLQFALQGGMELLLDSHEAMQSTGLRRLAHAVRVHAGVLRSAANVDVAASIVNSLVEVALKQLDNSDIPIMEAAIDLLSSLLRVKPPLLSRYLSLFEGGNEGAPLPIRSRVKIGEALSSACADFGRRGILVPYARQLLTACLKTGVSTWRETSICVESLSKAADPSHGNESEAYGLELQLADIADLRCSALVLLGEATAYLIGDYWQHAPLVLDGLSGVLQYESGGADEGPVADVIVKCQHAVLRAASYALFRINKGFLQHQLASTDDVKPLPAGLNESYKVVQASLNKIHDPAARAHLHNASTTMLHILSAALQPSQRATIGVASGLSTTLQRRVIGEGKSTSTAAHALHTAGSAIDASDSAGVVGSSGSDYTLSPWTTHVRTLSK